MVIVPGVVEAALRVVTVVDVEPAVEYAVQLALSWLQLLVISASVKTETVDRLTRGVT